MRRFTRLTNAFSKKVENHAAMVAIHFMYHNFGRIHKTLRVTPAMTAGLSDHVWSLEEIVLLALNNAKPNLQGDGVGVGVDCGYSGCLFPHLADCRNRRVAYLDRDNYFEAPI